MSHKSNWVVAHPQGVRHERGASTMKAPSIVIAACALFLLGGATAARADIVEVDFSGTVTQSFGVYVGFGCTNLLDGETPLVVMTTRDLALRRAMLPERRTGTTLGDVQLRSDLLNAGTATRGA